MSEKAVCKKQKRTEESNDEKAIDSEKAVCKKQKHTEESNDERARAIEDRIATLRAEMKKQENKSFEDLCKMWWTTKPEIVVEFIKDCLPTMMERIQKNKEESHDEKAIDDLEATVDAEMKKHQDKSFEDLCKWMWTTEPQCVVEIIKQGLRAMDKRENKD